MILTTNTNSGSRAEKEYFATNHHDKHIKNIPKNALIKCYQYQMVLMLVCSGSFSIKSDVRQGQGNTTALTLCFKESKTLKCFESESWFAFLFNNQALNPYMHTDTDKQENSFFLWEILIFADLITDSFQGRIPEGEA